MEISEILEKLKKDFELKDQHIAVISSIHEKELTADEICESTGIPKGRIYEFLNELLTMKLIEKEKQVPAKYNAKNFDKKVLDFLSLKFNDLTSKESGILSLLEEESISKEGMFIIDSNEKYVFRLMKLLNENKSFKNILKHKSCSVMLYPKDEEELKKVRSIVEKKRETLTSGKGGQLNLMLARKFRQSWSEKKQFEEVMSKNGFDFYFSALQEMLGKKELKNRINEIKKDLRENNVKITIVDEYVPYCAHIADKEMILVVTYGGLVLGFTIANPKIIEVYTKLFEDLCSRGKPIELYLDELYKKL